MHDVTVLPATLKQTPGWATMSAYARTKLLCRALARQGVKIPGWMAIRDLIEKGSATDINRAKRDHAEEQGKELSEADVLAAGLPEVLAKPMRDVYQAAVAYVESSYANRVAEWRFQLDRAGEHVAQAEAAQMASQDERNRLKAQVEGLQGQLGVVSEQLNAERASSAEARRIYEDSQTLLQEQLARRDEESKQFRAEMESAVTRLEGVEAHSLREVDRARTEAEQKVALVERKLADERLHNREQEARHARRMAELKGLLDQTESVLAALKEDARAFAARAERAEQQVDQLLAQDKRTGQVETRRNIKLPKRRMASRK